MLILTLRTDKPEAEVGLYQDDVQLAYEIWEAHRMLAETLHKKIVHLLQENGKDLHDLGGIVCYQGPGSFTGLRIGLSVVNALAYALQIPIIGAIGEDWLPGGLSELLAGNTDTAVMPEYGSQAHITPPKA